MRVALIHEWLVNYAGSERVLEQLVTLYPEADVFAVVDFLEPDERQFIANKPVTTSFIQRLPRARKQFRRYLPLMPLAIEQLDLSGYDLVISSSHAVAKGVITGPDQLHISYVHSPMRYVWDLQHQYLNQARLESGPMSWLTRYMLHRLRMWDVRSSNGVDYFVANSEFIRRRIRKTYRRDAAVIYPPVNVDSFPLELDKDDFYLTASRLVTYKRIDLIIEAFAGMPDRKLIIVGEGPEHQKLAQMANDNVELLGHLQFDQLRELMGKARAFVFAAEEDFGIVPVEAQACGTPVIAFARGGALETVQGLDSPLPTGVFFEEQTSASLQRAVEQFEMNEASFSPSRIRQSALRFSEKRFREEFEAFVDECWRVQRQTGTYSKPQASSAS
ncbi:MAG TPA: glycosyltransferase family 4 protein [Trueperaceae bacterium]